MFPDVRIRIHITKIIFTYSIKPPCILVVLIRFCWKPATASCEIELLGIIVRFYQSNMYPHAYANGSAFKIRLLPDCTGKWMCLILLCFCQHAIHSVHVLRVRSRKANSHLWKPTATISSSWSKSTAEAFAFEAVAIFFSVHHHTINSYPRSDLKVIFKTFVP
jgi:hypothetical protein